MSPPQDPLDEMKEIQEFLQDEKVILDGIKTDIDDALTSKQREIDLNESYRLRQDEYTRMKVVIVLALAVCIFIILINKRFPVIPSILSTLIILIIILVACIYCIFSYSTITTRSKMDYNKLDLTGPTVLTSSELEANRARAGKAGDLLGTIGSLGCVGSDCCNSSSDVLPADRTIWDNDSLKCVPAPVTQQVTV